jgi:hypothetical protein
MTENNYWNTLKQIYQYESMKLSGPASYRKDINDVLWTLEDFQNYYDINDVELENIKAVMDELLASKNALKIDDDTRSRYITRTAEISRLLGHNYEYWYRGRQSIDSVRWLISGKDIPRREILVTKFISMLNTEIESEIKDVKLVSNLKQCIKLVIEGIAKSILKKDWIEVSFSQFQYDSAREMILSQFKHGYYKKNQILTAGVGSGKTIAFCIGMLVSAVYGIKSGENSRSTHLFLYPRTALAQDQYTKIKNIVKQIKVPELSVHFEHSNYYRSTRTSVRKGIIEKYGDEYKHPPSIIVTTLETLNRRLQHPLFIKKLSKYLRRVVVDEVHLVEGITGCNIVRLLDRLRQICDNDLLWTASSATVANPDFHASTVFGIAPTTIEVLSPSADQLQTIGLVHHLFLRPSGRMSFLGSLVNSSSILVHNRRTKIFERDENHSKTIGFADSLDVLGRWNADFRENERTESVPTRFHPKSEVPDKSWSPRQRELPYALRFVNPFERRVNVVGGSEKGEPYEELSFTEKNICARCKSGERFSIGTVTKSDLSSLGKFVYRYEHLPTDNVKSFIINSDVFSTDELEIGTLDMCPFLKAGACFWFSGDNFETEKISKSNYEWKSVARSKIYSSKTKSDFELNEDLGLMVFTDNSRELYDVGNEAGVQVDLVFSSPSLEVGVDISNITESIMFKAIRNVASYRQKVGRIGREANTDVMNVNLLSLRPIDLHYYRQPKKLISRARLDPIPLKEHNESVLWSSLYMGVWDFLAHSSNLPEAIPLGYYQNETVFTQQLKHVADFIKNNGQKIARHLAGISRRKYGINSSILKDIIEQVLDEINLLLTPTVGTIDQSSITCLSDIIVHLLMEGRGVKISPPKQSFYTKLISDSRKEYTIYRPQVNPLSYTFSEDFRLLDKYEESGWIDELELNRIIQTISNFKDRNQDFNPETYYLFELLDALKKIYAGIEGMKKEGLDPIVITFLEQYSIFRTENRFKPYYLSYTIQDLPIFKLIRKKSAYTRPPNLFTNPYEEEVSLHNTYGVIEKVPVSESLYSFIPGTWTYRMGKKARKAAIGKLEPSLGGVLTASMKEMNRQGNEFDLIKTNVPAPPGFPFSSLDIYMPRRIKIINIREKYVLFNRLNRTIADKDEDFQSEGEEKLLLDEDSSLSGKNLLIKIPKSYLESWVHIIPDAGEKILVNNVDEEKLVLDAIHFGEDARKQIIHPLMDELLESIKWHDTLDVYDYIHSINRSYSTKGDNTAFVLFENNRKPMGIGSYYKTEGVSIALNSKTIQRISEKIENEIQNGDNKWLPSCLKAYQAIIKSIRLHDGTSISPFIVRDILGIIITYLSNESDLADLYQIQNIVNKLVENKELFDKIGYAYFEGKYHFNVDEEDTFDGLSEDDKNEIRKNIDESYLVLNSIKEEFNIGDKIKDWIKHTILNTFGVAATSALQKLSGSNEQMIGYAIDLELLKEQKYVIYLYDRTHYGNGSTDVIRRYMHILNIQRHGQSNESKLLPSYDYLTLLEQELLQCPQFHSDYDALIKYQQASKAKPIKGILELGYVGEFSDEILRVSKETWKKLGILGPQDAWKLPLISHAPGSFAMNNKIEMDDIIRSTNICWNGCPECVVNTAAYRSNSGNEFLDKSLLDEWFTGGISKTPEYESVKIKDLATGDDEISIGKQSKLCLNLPKRKIRSISLPYQIGYNIDRLNVDDKVRLLVRTDDVHGLRLFDTNLQSSHGIEALGFKRILWFNLLTMTYLDALDLYEDSRKVIHMVFYDCRDISFDDVGISERMAESLDHYRKKTGFKEINSLSDIIVWLAIRGFKINICLDEKQSREDGVKNFLDKLNISNQDSIHIYTKRLGGSMHKKALITPYAVIQGSANLTYSGTTLNEEIINFASYGSSEYDEMNINIQDTFYGAKRWIK